MRSLANVLLLSVSLIATAQVSPYNHRPAQQPDSSGHYRLVFSGHFHGSSSSSSGYPAATLLAGLDLINGLDANALVSTGDLFLNPDRDSARYRQALFQRLMPALFNAPGNHDREGHAYSGVKFPIVLTFGPDAVLLLDTEVADSDIEGAQLQALEQLATEGRWRRVFIVSHRPVWAEEDPAYGPLFKGNTRSLTGCNYRRDVLPVLERMISRTEVFWISGSMAGGAPASVFFQPHLPNLTFIQTAIRDELRDAVLVADVSGQGIAWRLVSLTGQGVQPVESYDSAWWRTAKAQGTQGFNWRLVPYLARTVITDHAFWWGAGAMFVLLLLLRALFRRWP